MNKFERSPLEDKCLLDEQMYLSDPQTALLFQIREELREMNHTLRQLNKPPETSADAPVEAPKTNKKNKKGE